MAKVRWGGLSTAKISTEKVLPALQQGEHCEVVGVASRSLESAQKAAEPLGIPKTYGSYEAMLADPEIDAVYNPLPNDFHVPWSIKALEAGKHVLCEKTHWYGLARWPKISRRCSTVSQFKSDGSFHVPSSSPMAKSP